MKKIVITGDLEYIGESAFLSTQKVVFTKLKKWEDEDGSVIDLCDPKQVKKMLFSKPREWKRKV